MAAGSLSLDPPGPKHARLRELDALRGLAAVAILVHHIVEFSIPNLPQRVNDLGAFDQVALHLKIGVPIFFVLSGFVIYAPFVRARHSGQHVELGIYGIRRFMRIMPPYWVVLTVFGVIFGLRGVFGSDGWRHYSLTQVWWANTSQFGRDNGYFHSVGLPPAWTLSAEVLFYATVPILAFVVARLIARRRAALGLEVALIVGLGLLSIALRRAGLSLMSPGWLGAHGYLFSTFPALFLWFVPGMLLAALAGAPSSPLARAPRWMASLPICSALALAGFGMLCLDALPLDLEYPVTAIVAGLIVVPVVVRAAQGERTRILLHPAVLWLGLVSYSLYLVHYPIVRWAADHGMRSLPVLALVAGTSALLCAWAVSQAVEQPSQRLGRRWSEQLRRRHSGVGPVGAAPVTTRS